MQRVLKLNLNRQKLRVIYVCHFSDALLLGALAVSKDPPVITSVDASVAVNSLVAPVHFVGDVSGRQQFALVLGHDHFIGPSKAFECIREWTSRCLSAAQLASVVVARTRLHRPVSRAGDWDFHRYTAQLYPCKPMLCLCSIQSLSAKQRCH